jgi:hypothetical protein
MTALANGADRNLKPTEPARDIGDMLIAEIGRQMYAGAKQGFFRKL